MNLGNLLTPSGLPRTDYPAGQQVFWLIDDNVENFRQRGGHPVYGEKDIIYNFNSFGYRCPEFDAAADIRIVAIGCSFVLGKALPQRAIFHEIFAEKLRATESQKTVVVWNLGLGGASNDYISRMLYLAVPRLDPHIVLVNFTHLSRREYVSVQDRHLNYNPSFKPPDAISRDIYGHFAGLSSPFDDQLNFFKNYKAVEQLLAGRVWLYSHIHPLDLGPVTAHMDPRRFAGPLLTLDRARDNGHPGPESHRQLAELYWTKFAGLGRLPQKS